MQSSTLDSIEAIKNLRSDWNRLAEVHRNPLLEFEWFYCAAQHLHAQDTPNVLVISNVSGAPTAIAPLVLTQDERSKWLQLLGAQKLYEPSGLLFDDDSSLKLMLGEIADQEFPVLLSRLDEQFMRPGSSAPPLIASGAWLTRRAAGSPVLDLDSDWDGFLRSMSSRRRYDYRRAKKRAAQAGVAEFRVVRPSLDEFDGVLTSAFDVEDKGWKGRHGTSIKRDSDMRSFVLAFCRQMVNQSALRVFFQYIDDEPVAMALCVQKYGSLWFIKIGYDENFRRCSPGMLLLMDIVRYCCENRIFRIEHLGTMDGWLDPWTSFVRPYSTLIHYPASVRGASLLFSDASRSLLGKVRTIVKNQGARS